MNFRKTLNRYLTSAFAALLAVDPLAAREMRIDFGADATTSGAGWNNVSAPTNGSEPWAARYGATPATLVTNLKDTGGNLTGISLIQQLGAATGLGAALLTGTSLSTAGTATGYPSSALTDVIFVSADSSVSYRLTGLRPGGEYELTFFSGLDASRPADSTQITVSGVNALPTLKFSPTGNTSPQKVTVTATTRGMVDIVFSGVGSSGHLNAMGIREFPPPPTPGTAIFLKGN